MKYFYSGLFFSKDLINAFSCFFIWFRAKAAWVHNLVQKVCGIIQSVNQSHIFLAQDLALEDKAIIIFMFHSSTVRSTSKQAMSIVNYLLTIFGSAVFAYYAAEFAWNDFGMVWMFLFLFAHIHSQKVTKIYQPLPKSSLI